MGVAAPGPAGSKNPNPISRFYYWYRSLSQDDKFRVIVACAIASAFLGIFISGLDGDFNH
jgi:hypothetical protein